MTEESRRRLVEAAPGFGIRVLASAATEASALPSVLSAIEALDVMGKGWVKLEAGQAEHVGPNIRHAIRNSSQAQAADGHDRSHGALLPDIGAPASGPEPPPPRAAEVAAFPAHVAAYRYWVASPAENAAVGLGFN